jgi:predicted dinucleotide-binding enzyme
MEIGVIGLNDFSKEFFKHWIVRGHDILFADVHLHSSEYGFAEVLGPQVSHCLPEQISRQAEIIVLAVPMKYLEAAIRSLGSVKQKIVVDLVDEKQGDTSAKLSSFQVIKQMLPEAKVVKVTPDYPFHLNQPKSNGPETLYSYSNDHLAQRMVRWFLNGSHYKMIDLNIQTIL